MDGILEFFQTPLGMLLIGIGLILFKDSPIIVKFKDSPIIVKILEFLKIKNPTPQPEPIVAETTLEEITPPDRDDAFVAANILVKYYDNKVKVEKNDECEEGLEAAKKAGQCLFH